MTPTLRKDGQGRLHMIRGRLEDLKIPSGYVQSKIRATVFEPIVYPCKYQVEKPKPCKCKVPRMLEWCSKYDVSRTLETCHNCQKNGENK